ncbi:MAG: YlbL family protein [Actinomycetota bacterium]
MQRDSDLPEPTDQRPVKGLRPWRWAIVSALFLGLGLLAIFVPIPFFYAYLPGPVRDVEKLVHVAGVETYSSEGQLYLTTVSVDIEVTLVDWVTYLVDPNSVVVMKEQVTGGASFEDLEARQIEEMKGSKKNAEEVVFARLGIAAPTGDGARFEATQEGSPADGKLLEGDVIVSIDDQRIETTCDVDSAMDAHAPGETVTIQVQRDGSSEDVTLEAGRSPTDPEAGFLGIFMSDVGYEFDSGAEVEFETGEIAGPSAGLMFSLALYDRLTPDDLTGGRAIAGTGEITCGGGVGPIGGIEQKVAGAEAEGAEVFLAPAANFEAARAAADEIEVVRISNFAQAVEYLEDSA